MKVPFTFLIPLVGKDITRHYAAVLNRLQHTLDSLKAQTDPDWTALLCVTNQQPTDPDPRFQWLSHPSFHVQTGPRDQDKWHRKAMLFSTWAARKEPGWVFLIDADDLFERHLVEYVRSHVFNTWTCVSFEKGFIWNARLGRIAACDNLHEKCGSVCAAGVAPDDVKRLEVPHWDLHKGFPVVKRPSDRYVAYVVEHGGNLCASQYTADYVEALGPDRLAQFGQTKP